MPPIQNPVPHLSNRYHSIESTILNHVPAIEAWFSERWEETPAPITSSVDLRHAGFKLAPVDTNLFPAGFNNLNPQFMPRCVQAAQSILEKMALQHTNILIVPESHTRNPFYFQSLHVLRDIFTQAGFNVRLGGLDSTLTSPVEHVVIGQDDSLRVEPLLRRHDRLVLDDFDPCFVLLNNDLSSGVPDLLQGLQDSTQPPVQLGWSSRLKSDHFQYFSDVTREFAALVHLDDWLITPLFKTMDGVDFMAQRGLDALALVVDELLTDIREKYATHGIVNKPFVVVKADNGTYGMGVMMVHEGAQLQHLNRKQRTRMSATKGHQKLNRLIIQEGVYSFDTMPDGATAEPVLYMIGSTVVGGFYRIHPGRGPDENLNSPGMHFKPFPFVESCDSSNPFYTDGVIARLAALAAAREMAGVRATR